MTFSVLKVTNFEYKKLLKLRSLAANILNSSMYIKNFSFDLEKIKSGRDKSRVL